MYLKRGRRCAAETLSILAYHDGRSVCYLVIKAWMLVMMSWDLYDFQPTRDLFDTGSPATARSSGVTACQLTCHRSGYCPHAITLTHTTFMTSLQLPIDRMNWALLLAYFSPVIVPPHKWNSWLGWSCDGGSLTVDPRYVHAIPLLPHTDDQGTKSWARAVRPLKRTSQ